MGQISLNLAFGSAMASIGLTIPTIAVASIWLPVPLHLGLDAIHIVLLALTCVVAVLTVVPGRATLLQAGAHLALLAAYLFLAASPRVDRSAGPDQGVGKDRTSTQSRKVRRMFG